MKESLGPQYCHGPEGGGPALITSHNSSPVSRSLPPQPPRPSFLPLPPRSPGDISHLRLVPGRRGWPLPFLAKWFMETERGLGPPHCPTMGHFQRELRKVMG